MSSGSAYLRRGFLGPRIFNINAAMAQIVYFQLLIMIKELVSMNNDLLKQLPILFAKGEAYPQMLRRRLGELPAFAGACEEADL